MSCVDKDFPDSVGLTDDSMSSICSDDDYNYENGDGVRDEKGAAGGDKALKSKSAAGGSQQNVAGDDDNNIKNKLTTNSTKAAVATDRTTQNSDNVMNNAVGKKKKRREKIRPVVVSIDVKLPPRGFVHDLEASSNAGYGGGIGNASANLQADLWQAEEEFELRRAVEESLQQEQLEKTRMEERQQQQQQITDQRKQLKSQQQIEHAESSKSVELRNEQHVDEEKQSGSVINFAPPPPSVPPISAKEKIEQIVQLVNDRLQSDKTYDEVKLTIMTLKQTQWGGKLPPKLTDIVDAVVAIWSPISNQ